MSTNNLQAEVVSAIQNLFPQIQDDSELLDFETWKKQMIAKIEDRTLFMLRSNLDHLMHLLYRIDVDQKRVDRAFDLGEIHQIAHEIATLIFERQLKKVEYRLKNN